MADLELTQPSVAQVYVSYDERSEGGGIVPGEENESFPNREPAHHQAFDFQLHSEVTYPGRHFYCKEVPADHEMKRGDIGYLVYVEYRTGDTFGYSTGNVSLVGVFKEAEDADLIARSIKTGKYEGFKWWDGYFDRLESVMVERLTMDEPSYPRRY